MGLHRAPLAFALPLAIAWRGRQPASTPPASSSPPTIAGRPIRVDADRKLLPWSTAPSPYAHVARLAWTALETRFPTQDNGLPTFLAYSRFDPGRVLGRELAAQPRGPLRDAHRFGGALVRVQRRRRRHRAGRAARSTTSSRTGRRRATGTGRACPTRARTPATSTTAGADDAWCDFCGRGDGAGVIEPDKVGELGVRLPAALRADGRRALPGRRRRVRRRAREARARGRRTHFALAVPRLRADQRGCARSTRRTSSAPSCSSTSSSRLRPGRRRRLRARAERGVRLARCAFR